MLDVPEILASISKYTGHQQVRGGYGLKIDGRVIHPSVSLEDAMVLAAAMSIGVRYYNHYSSVATTHTVVISEHVESWVKSSIQEATITAVLTTAYRVAVSGRR